MNIEEEREIAKVQLKEAQKQLNKLQKKYDEIEEQYQKKVGKMYAGVNIKTRKGSYLITREDGLAVTMSIHSNSYNERNIYWYDGKKGAVALNNTRMGHKKVALWLREYLDI